MAKKITSALKENEETTGGLNVVELNNNAFSIVYTGNKRYSVVKIRFAAGSTNSAGPIETIASELDYYEAQHVFKTETVKGGVFDQGVDKVE